LNRPSWSEKEDKELLKAYLAKAPSMSDKRFSKTYKSDRSPEAVRIRIGLLMNKTGLRDRDIDDEDLFPAVLVLDIETLPIKAYAWDVWNTNIGRNQIIEDWCVLSWSAKWLNDDRMISDCLTPKEALKRDDKRIVKSVWKLLEEAEVIIVQNGRRFDVPKLNTRFWKHRIPHNSSFKIIDTLDSAKKSFGMTFNSLDYLGEYLGAGRKLKTDFELWALCDNGDKEALETMQTYNENDVILLERVYLTMRAWITNHPRLTTYEKVIGVCPVCFSRNFTDIGVYTAVVRQYLEFRCTDCGAIWHNTKCEK
jgi:predicted PolB exonuclease-like 3'-5' exonuclease